MTEAEFEKLAQRDRDARGKTLVAWDHDGHVVQTWEPGPKGMWHTARGYASYAAIESECRFKHWILLARFR